MSQDATQPSGSAEQAPRKLAGKYESTEALEQGYQNLNREFSRGTQRSAQLEAENQQLRTLLAGQPAGTPESLQRLEEAGLPIDAFRTAIVEAVRPLIGEALAPLVRGAEAAGLVKDPNGAAMYLREHPEFQDTYQALVAKNPQHAAMVLDSLMATEAGQRAEAGAQTGAVEADATRTTQKRDAAIISSRPESREPAAAGPQKNERLEALRERAAGGDYKDFVKEVLTTTNPIKVWLPGEDKPQVLK